MKDRLGALYPERNPKGGRVLYWMQASVRVRDNLALAVAQREAADRGLALSILYCLDLQDPSSSLRSLSLVLDGLEDAAAGLKACGLGLTIVLSPPVKAVVAAAADAALLVFDLSYLHEDRQRRLEIGQAVGCPILIAEDNVVVPTSTVTGKEEWSAATIRPKLMHLAGVQPFLPRVLVDGVADGSRDLARRLTDRGFALLTESPSRRLAAGLTTDSLPPSPTFRGGETQAWMTWERFRDDKLEHYDLDRNDPNKDGQSGLGPSLHLGHLSPLSLVEDLKRRGLWREALSFRRAGEDPVSKFLDELIVRRELSVNLVLFNPDYGTWHSLPPWARRTLTEHSVDQRAAVYSRSEWEEGRTHDAIWNAAQYQLSSTGVLHGYLRMYWGKKILEWSRDPAQAYLDALYLNNRFALDGHDPNSYAGVAWCFGKHDRPWGERPVYGTVRSMTSGGLRKKFDIDAYVRRFTPPS